MRVTVIVAARGYPGTPASGGLIREIEAAEQVEGVTVFHAGTAVGDQGLIAQGDARFKDAQRHQAKRVIQQVAGDVGQKDVGRPQPKA